MIHRLQMGDVPAKPHTVFAPEGELAFEHCFTRQGFDGNYSILYHRQPPHWIASQELLGLHPGFSDTEPVAHPLRRHFITERLADPGTAFGGRQRLLANADLGIWFAVADAADPELSCNADGDELVFVFAGSGTLNSAFGALVYGPGDYVYIPRGVVHRWEPAERCRLLILEGHSWIDLLAQYRNASGQLKMDAPYSHRDFRAPIWSADQASNQPFEVLVKRQQHLTRMLYAHHPFDVLGWDGMLWPFAFNIRDFQPKTGQVHLPPTVHGTFAGGGFLVCSFVPRLVDFHPQAIPCPYPHSSVDCDELLFYVEGNFTSRKGIGPGSISLHPAGLPHGPHPGTYEASIGSDRTNEMAVMVDTFKPLLPTLAASGIEDADYQMSWMQVG
ncbi:MAG: homogentisate 1,2-dioxygenase [Candidatus Melainabacteria bacterium HGW-Melainabacteria-1]|nr:MAG: homogentisate 1,2-dioxygenase [Candidatus Melainabacteria bacterium HGW-Melainabacteria-1]